MGDKRRRVKWASHGISRPWSPSGPQGSHNVIMSKIESKTGKSLLTWAYTHVGRLLLGRRDDRI